MMQLCGGDLPGQKREDLHAFLSVASNRAWLSRLLDDLGQHAPALYVGETESLATRIRQHMSGQSPFGMRVEANQYLDWRVLDLYYADLGPGPGNVNQRTALEYLTAVLSVAGMTSRPG